MSSLYFPIASMFVCVLLYVVFNNKARQENAETKIYSKMIFINLIETTTAVLIISIAKIFGTVSSAFYLDRLDFILISLWCCSLFEYIYNLSGNLLNKNVKVLMYFIIILSLVFAPFSIVNYSDIIDTAGLAPILVSIYCGVFALLMLVSLLKTVFFSDKNVAISKYYPLFVFIGLIALSLVLRSVWPTMVLEPFMISFINLIMFFTIENPDLKMIEQLEVAKESAEKYGNEKSNFIFNMSQNIREPLKNIEMLSDEITNAESLDEVNLSIQNIKYAVQKIQYYVTNSLDISTMEAKNLRIVDGKYDLRKIVEQENIKVKRALKDKDIEYRYKISEMLPKIFYGDSIRIKQILNTLLFNSIKYTEEGFIELNIDSIIKQDICRLIITVEDSGCGIKSKEIDKLFEKHDVEECKVDNNTLTLDTLKKMVNFIGGTVMVQSEQKKGTKFIVTLDQKFELTEDDSPILEQKGKILFITNRDTISKQITKTSLSDKYDIKYVSGGEQALKKVRSGEKYNLIFIDYKIDKLDYRKTLSKLNGISGFSTPVILISSKDDRIDSSDFSAVIKEPIRVKELKTCIEKHIS